MKRKKRKESPYNNVHLRFSEGENNKECTSNVGDADYIEKKKKKRKKKKKHQKYDNGIHLGNISNAPIVKDAKIEISEKENNEEYDASNDCDVSPIRTEKTKQKNPKCEKEENKICINSDESKGNDDKVVQEKRNHTKTDCINTNSNKQARLLFTKISITSKSPMQQLNSSKVAERDVKRNYDQHKKVKKGIRLKDGGCSDNQGIKDTQDIKNTPPKIKSKKRKSKQKPSELEKHTEDPPFDWFSPLHYVTGTYDRKKLDLLEKDGIVRKTGKWSDHEIQTLENNMKHFLEIHPVKDFARLIIPTTNDEFAFRKKTQFALYMCRGIQRTRFEVSQRTVTQFSDFLQKGKFTKEEKEELLKLNKLHQNNWKEIGILMNRSHFNLQNVHNYTVSPKIMGPWGKEEDERLIKAVKPYLEQGEKISWTDVAKIVGTRVRVECRGRWRTKHIQSQQGDFTENIDFNDTDAFKLISIITESGIDDNYLMDWNALSKQFNGSVTPNWLKWKFGVICKEVCHSFTLEFGELIEQLYEIYERKISNVNYNESTVIEKISDNKWNDKVVVIA